MNSTNITAKIIAMVLIGGFCFIASLLVMGLTYEREGRHQEASHEIGQSWSREQTIVGPMLVFEQEPETEDGLPTNLFLLPTTLHIESTIEPEVRKRGIFETIVYSERLNVSGSFSASDLPSDASTESGTLILSLTDTRSIEQQVALTWGEEIIDFLPGTANQYFLDAGGMHAPIVFDPEASEYQFSFSLTIKGSQQMLFTPVGKETRVSVQSPWPTPSFTGAFLPSERTITDAGFTASWNVSSFGRSYPQTWEGMHTIPFHTFAASAFGVKLHEGVDLYTQLTRSVKYAVLFIVVTFTAFFLFEVLAQIRIHPLQYILIGSALALFYLLLLSFAEHIGFMRAYVTATTMIVLLITAYSASVLKQKFRAFLIGILLSALYGYLYFVLKLEDYALLFGSLLLFFLLANVMYLTRNIDWFNVSK